MENEDEVVQWRAAATVTAAEKGIRSGNGGREFSCKSRERCGAAIQKPSRRLSFGAARRAEFARESITFRQLSTMIDRATRAVPADFLDAGDSLNELYLIVHAVDDLASGAYVYRRDLHALELLKAGDFRRDADDLGLGQDIPADCSVNVYFLADLNKALKHFGNRGYRAAQLEASIMGGKLYLAAYAQSLGASGLTFFDDDVTEFFAPDAAGKSAMFLIALGKSVKRKSQL